MTRAPQTVLVDVPAGRLTVRIVGDGRPVLLLPGGAATSYPYYPHLEEELDGCRVISFDRPGTGTACGLGTATLPSGSASIEAVLNAVDATEAVVVGHSLGGSLAIQYAIDHPGEVGGVILLDPTPINDARLASALPRVLGLMSHIRVAPKRLSFGQKFTFRRLRRSLGPLDDEALICLRSLVYSAGIAATADAVSTFGADAAALTGRLRPLVKPVVLVTADRRPAHRLHRNHVRLAEALGGELQMWPGTKHPLHLQQPARLARLIDSVLAQQPRS